MSNRRNGASDAQEFKDVWLGERKQIIERRASAWCDPDRDNVADHPKIPGRGSLGVAFSGGGIRSATYNLGILQGLIQRGLLPHIDYLSTVSGGGYVGTWLHGVIRRFGGGYPVKAAKALSHPIPGPPAEDPVTFLRNYSSYLAPKMGLFSADFWVILVIWLRNMLLNLLILVPLLAMLSLSAMGVGFIGKPSGMNDSCWGLICGVVAATLLATVAVSAALGARAVTTRRDSTDEDPHKPSDPVGFGDAVAIGAALAVLLASFLLAKGSSAILSATCGRVWLIVAMAGTAAAMLFALQAIGGFLNCYRFRHHERTGFGGVLLLFLPLVSGAVTALLLFCSLQWISQWGNSAEAEWNVVAWGTPLIMLIWLAGAGLHIGLMGVDFPDSGRECLARMGSYVVIAAFCWSLLYAVAVFGPYWISWLFDKWWGNVAALAGGWIATTIGGVLAGKSPKTGAPADAPGNSNVLELVGKIAPTVFLVGFLLLISAGVHAGLRGLTPGAGYWSAPDPKWWWEFFAVAGALVVLLPLRFNINEFSMHHFNKNRIVRCYLGASRGKQRSPSRLTGFDDRDDFPISELLPTQVKPYYGPYPIVCGTLSLNAGSELAKRERQGESFVFTPLYCGFNPPKLPEDVPLVNAGKVSAGGYHRTCGYGYPAGPAIGTAMAISGAAANPNHGYHTSAPMAFLMTIFDVRLGWWVGNPRLRDPSQRPGPRHALRPLISELFAQTDQRSAYLNLSDGGNFENLGLYELVRRRCEYIIVGDGEQDTDLTFESLGGAVRKCRTDFGVEIEIDPKRIRRGKDGFSTTHCVIGKIRYPEDPRYPGDDKAKEGLLLYLKASLTGDEPEDVTQYQAAHKDFPQQNTLNQFFTESQFESYRRLGLHIVESVFENVKQEEKPMDELFECLYQQWYPPSNVPEGGFSRHTEAYSEFIKRLANDPDLLYFESQILWDKSGRKPELPKDRTLEEVEIKGILYCADLIQLMENVWWDLQLYKKEDRENPKNGGWMDTFRFWAHQDIFRKAWERTSYTFNPLFHQFFHWAQHEDPPSVHPKNPCGDLPPSKPRVTPPQVDG